MSKMTIARCSIRRRSSSIRTSEDVHHHQRPGRQRLVVSRQEGGSRQLPCEKPTKSRSPASTSNQIEDLDRANGLLVTLQREEIYMLAYIVAGGV
jgi:hypothetical protein